MTSDAAPRRAERKRASVMFADLVGFTALSERIGSERAYLIVTECLKRLDAVARRHGGAVDKYLGDCLMAVFGHPVPLQDHAGAAVESGLEMLRLVDDYARDLELEVPLEIRIGLNTGSLVAGDLRGRAIREFHVLGDAVNVAARLKGRAPLGHIYVGAGTEAETRGRFDYRRLESMQLKGKQQRVETFEVSGSQRPAGGSDSLTGFETVLVGRERELSRLEARVDGLTAKHGAVVALVGEEGIGKSRLVRALHRRIDEAGRDVDWYQADTSDGLRALESRLAEVPPGRRVVAVVEDLQRADARSIATLEALLPRVEDQPVLFLLVARPGGVESERLRAGLDRFGDRFEEIRPAPLAHDDTLRLLEALGDGEALPPDMLALVEERAAGNPRRIILGAFLAPALRSESERGEDRGADAERRRATVLFADMSGFTSLTETLGDERAYAIVAESLQRLDDVAARHGGTVDKYMGDCVMALFGVPRAIEDAPRAAINAAIEMRQVIRDFNRERGLDTPLDVHSGINTGLAIAGDISGPLLREFALMGDPVDVADHLKDDAPPGGIWIGDETYRFTRDVFEFRPATAVRLVGRAGEIPSWDVLSDRPQIHRRRVGAPREIFSKLVGRDAELSQLRGSLAAVASGQGGIVHLSGEAGLGKSRLLAELRASDEASHVEWLEGRSLSSGQQLSFHPFGDLLRSWAGIGDDDPDDAVPAKLQRALEGVFGEEMRAVYPFLGSIAGLRLLPDEQERVDSVPGDVIRKVLQGNLIDLLRRESSRRPLVLVFDDLQWADLSSIELLEALLRTTATDPILIVNVFRGGFEATSERVLEAARAEHAGRSVEVELRPLPEHAARALIANLFRHADLPYEVRRLLVSRSGGNPLYVEEVVRSWVEEGAVEVTDQGFLATDRVQHAVLPATVGEVILARIDGLPPDEKEVLRVAAVIGGSFQEAVLVQYFDDKERLARDLASLEAGQYIVRRERSQGARGGVEYAFKNPLAQELVYDGMLLATREELHRSVGEAIENALTENVPGYHAMLAYHFSLANDVARAEESLFRAGDEAARSSASNEALHFFQEASKLYVQVHAGGGDLRKRAHLEKNIANALYNRGMVKESLEHFHAALECMGERVLRHPLALQARFAGDLLAILARLYAGRMLRRPREADAPTQEIIKLMHRRSEVESTAEPTRFLFDSVATIRRVLQLDPAGLAQADGLLAGGVGIFSFGGVSFSIGQRFLDVARRAAEANAGYEPDVLFRFMAYLHYFLSGDWSPEHEIPDEVLDESLRKGRLMEVTMYSEVVADKLLRQGRFESVGPWQERIERVWDTFEYLPARVGRYLLQMQVAYARRSADTPALAEAFAEEVGGEGLHLFALGHEADVRTARGELEEAAAAIAKGEEILARPGRRLPYHLSAFTTARFRYDVARLEAAAGGERAKREAAARKSASHAVRAAKGAVFREAELARLQGRLAWLRGRHDEALREWGRSLDAAESLDLAPDAARTAAELAVRLRDPGAPKHEFRGRSPEDWAECAMAAFAGLSLDHDRTALEAKFR